MLVVFTRLFMVSNKPIVPGLIASVFFFFALALLAALLTRLYLFFALKMPSSFY
jgi:hypothetical protein